jgi:hypothetical protein
MEKKLQQAFSRKEEGQKPELGFYRAFQAQTCHVADLQLDSCSGIR